MAKLIKKLKNGVTIWEAEEGDPIYSEGWTIGPVPRKKSLKEFYQNAGSALTVQFDGEEQRRTDAAEKET
jgi:hypothetical protein